MYRTIVQQVMDLTVRGHGRTVKTWQREWACWLFGEELERIGQLSVQQDLVVQVGAGRSTGFTDIAMHITALHLLSCDGAESREVAVARHDPVSVICCD